MDPALPHIRKLIASAAAVLVISVLFHLLKRSAKRTHLRFNIRQSRYFATKRLLTMASLAVNGSVLILIWNVSIKNIWGSLTGILTLIAVAFFAMWSILANILAGIVIYFTSPFKIDDIIEVMPDEITGTVLAINTFYTVLMDSDGNYVSVPNSLFLQKYIKRTKRRSDRPPEAGTTDRRA